MAKKKITRRKVVQKSGSLAALGGGILSQACRQGSSSSGDLSSRESSKPLSGKLSISSLSDGQKADKKFFIVLTGFGGAAINDSFLALSKSEVQAAGGDPEVLNCFDDSQLVAVPGTDFKAVKIEHEVPALGGFKVVTDQSAFLRKHKDDMTVVTTEGTSVNHGIAQQRSVNGNEAWGGRTIQEVAAASFGGDSIIPYINMGSGGFALSGADKTLEEYAKAMTITNPLYWPLGLSSTKGLETSVDPQVLALTRKIRDEKLVPLSNFDETFKADPAIRKWRDWRKNKREELERLSVYDRLFFLNKTDDPAVEKAKKVFPNYLRDPFEAQAILAYLALTRDVSSVVTLGPDAATATSEMGIQDFINIPIAFDFSHNDHRGTQAHMWARMLGVADRLIDLLKGAPLDEQAGVSFWDRTVVYIATDFGRSKTRPSGVQSFGTAHDLNNGVVVISPMLKGNRTLGGIDPKTALTYGFDQLGRPDPGKKTSELEMYSLLANILGIDISGTRLVDYSKLLG